jgi:hypothetical protein
MRKTSWESGFFGKERVSLRSWAQDSDIMSFLALVCIFEIGPVHGLLLPALISLNFGSPE